MLFRRVSAAFAFAAAFAAAVEPLACGRDEESVLQSVSLLQKDTVVVKGMHGGSTRVMAELTPSGEAFVEDGAISFAPATDLQHDAAAEQHLLHEAVAPAAAAASATEHVKPMGAAEAALAAQSTHVRKTPLADVVGGHFASKGKTRRTLPGVSLLGRMAATVARHGIHAAHKAGAISQAPHPHEEDAETLLVAACLFLLAMFSMGCLVLEHRSKERADAHAMKILASAASTEGMIAAGGGATMSHTDANLPGQDIQQHEVSAAVGAPIASGPVRVA